MGRHPGYQLWFSIQRLAMLLELGESTVRRKLREGAFGPPAGQAMRDYVIDLGGTGGIRISTLGYLHFLDRHQLKYDEEVAARNAAELKRKLQTPN